MQPTPIRRSADSAAAGGAAATIVTMAPLVTAATSVPAATIRRTFVILPPWEVTRRTCLEASTLCFLSPYGSAPAARRAGTIDHIPHYGKQLCSIYDKRWRLLQRTIEIVRPTSVG